MIQHPPFQCARNSFCEWNGTRLSGPVAFHSTPRNFRTSVRKFWLNGKRPALQATSVTFSCSQVTSSLSKFSLKVRKHRYGQFMLCSLLSNRDPEFFKLLVIKVQPSIDTCKADVSIKKRYRSTSPGFYRSS